MIFPFEDHKLTQGLWWHIDRGRNCWRTIGWDIDDPEFPGVYEENSNEGSTAVDTEDEGDVLGRSYGAEEASSQSGSDLDDLVAAVRSLTIPEQINDEKLFIDSHCVLNELEAAQQIYNQSKDPRALIDKVRHLGDKPILLAACEEGHIDVVTWLLEQTPDLEACNEDGETVLVQAASYGYGRIACLLIGAGADMSVRSNHGESLQVIARQAKDLQVQFRDSDRRFASNNPTAKLRLRKRGLETTALEDLDVLCEFREAQAHFERMRSKLVALHGSSQAEHFLSSGAFDQEDMNSTVLYRIAKLPRSGKLKTVTCLSRTSALPYVFAVSGYDKGPFGSIDNALDRLTWLKAVFRLAALLKHDLPEHFGDKEGMPDSWHACHAEKQVLAFMISKHTTALMKDNAGLGQCSAPGLSKFSTEIFVSQPGRKDPYICDDCVSFCGKAAKKFDMRLRLLTVHDTGGARLHSKWPRE